MRVDFATVTDAIPRYFEQAAFHTSRTETASHLHCCRRVGRMVTVLMQTPAIAILDLRKLQHRTITQRKVRMLRQLAILIN